MNAHVRDSLVTGFELEARNFFRQPSLWHDVHKAVGDFVKKRSCR
jgi:hypothetical protein